MIAALLSLVSSLSSHFVLPCFLIPACVSWINPCLAVRTLFVPHLDYCSCYWNTPLLKPSGYYSPIKTHTCPRITRCLASVCWCIYPACVLDHVLRGSARHVSFAPSHCNIKVLYKCTLNTIKHTSFPQGMPTITKKWKGGPTLLFWDDHFYLFLVIYFV